MGLGNLWRNNLIRRGYVRSKQRRHLTGVHASTCKRAIVFLVPGKDRVNGGIISIISLAEETAKLREIHGADVFVCTLPSDPTLLRFTKFVNSTSVVELELLLDSLGEGVTVLLHVPEIFVPRLAPLLPRLATQHPGVGWQFNILLQNIDGIPKKSEVQSLSYFGPITCTTAHKAYSNDETAERIGCAVHHFSTLVSPEKYIWKERGEKENLVVLSPDKHQLRDRVLDALKEGLPGYRFETVRRLTYEQYKELIARAKFSITFGEGLDGYLVEPVFSGGIGAAVYNERFFTEEMRGLPFIYRSMEELMNRFPSDATDADCDNRYQLTQRCQFDMLASHYSHEKYVENLMAFYRARFRVQP